MNLLLLYALGMAAGFQTGRCQYFFYNTFREKDGSIPTWCRIVSFFTITTACVVANIHLPSVMCWIILFSYMVGAIGTSWYHDS